jgi:hypothetical protein
MKRALALSFALAFWWSCQAAADPVVPSERVRSSVNVREQADRTSRVVGTLKVGEQADYLGAAEGWFRVRLADGTLGFVSAPWTRVVPQAPAASPERPARRKPFLTGFFEGFRRFSWARPANVEVVIRDPDAAQTVYRNTDPDLPVAGFALLEDSGNFHDIVLVLDRSTSTNEHTGMDVDADGEVDGGWMGSDSIFAAQILAAGNFVRALRDLPHNRQGQRIRLGIVTYAGDEELALAAQDRDLDLAADTVYRLAARDAQVRLPLTHDYGAVQRELERLASETPVGMTDVAAGVGRAIIELEGLSAWGAQSEARQAQKVILFLTDGKPRLPYGKRQAERVAAFAGKLASQAGIRINAFALGENAVTRSTNDAVKRMARRTGGSHTALENPGEVVSVLETTPFSIVDRVQIVNRTTSRATRYIATGIDGSFYGEVPLLEGPNEIEVAAVMTDGRTVYEQFTIRYVHGAPERELEEQLKHLRIENEALIERIKADMARDIVRVRKREEQRRSLELKGDETRARWPADLE